MDPIRVVLVGLPAMLRDVLAQVFATDPAFMVRESEGEELPGTGGGWPADVIVVRQAVVQEGDLARTLLERDPDLVLVIITEPPTTFRLVGRSGESALPAHISPGELVAAVRRLYRDRSSP